MILVGATTENPFFTINSALVSRSRIFQFQPLSSDDIKTLLLRAVADPRPRPGPIPGPSARRRPGVPGRNERRRRPPGAFGAGGRRALQPASGRSSSPARWPRSRCSGRRAIRSRRRRALRLDQRADQEHSRQRSRRGPLLAGADARRRRGRALSRPAAGDPGQRGRGQRRSGRAAAGGGRGPRLRAGRAARMPAHLGPGGDLSGLRTEVERGHGRHRRGPRRRARGPPAARAGPSSRFALRRREALGPRARLPVRARRRERPSPRRIISASSASTIGRSIAASRKN